MKSFFTRLLREPLLHFFAAGGLIFVLYAAIDTPDDISPDVIFVSAARIDQLATRFSSVWKRNPTEKELNTLIEGDVREEVYYREAVELGLDQNDAVVRQRLRQKMEFLTDTSAHLLVPTDEELQAYWSANSETYQQGTRWSVEQIYLGQTPAPDDVARSLKRLKADPAMNTSELGERSLLPAQLSLLLPEAIDGVYGRGFFEQIENLPTDLWFGPVVSAYGTHLVRVLDVQPAQLPPLEQVREAVVRDWQAEKARELRELDYARRRVRFVIEIAPHDVQRNESQ